MAPAATPTDRIPTARGGLAVAAWVLAFAGIVAIATAGRFVTGPAGPRVAAIAVAPPSTTPPEAPAAAIAPLPELIVLSSPAIANTTVTTRVLAVRGYLNERHGTIWVTLEARGNRVIDQATIELTPAVGKRSTVGRRVSFETSFGLPNPRPNGRMIVQVALLDADGRILDVIRRPFRVGPLLEAADG
jgi:hypothetical protein